MRAGSTNSLISPSTEKTSWWWNGGLAGQRELLPDDRIVASEIGEVTARFDGSFRQSKVQAIGHRGERTVVPAHQPGSSFLSAGIQRDRADFLFARDFVYPGRDFASSFQIAIGKGDRLQLRLPGHVKRRRRTHHAGTDDQEFHASPRALFKQLTLRLWRNCSPVIEIRVGAEI